MVTDSSTLLSDPLVLRAAWKRVSSWYRGTEWHDPFEIADFELNLPERLTQIGKELREGTYEPTPFRLVPYPKKGTHLRHYCAPSVCDQVAFMVFGVLMGPLIDRRLQPFVFGNRIYRALGQDRSKEGAWKRRPYELDARQLYMPYRRDYALFRRVAHWSAAAMVDADTSAVDAHGETIEPDHFERAAIPACCRAAWWKGKTNGEGYWARLDLRMAFPCVTRDLVRRGLEYALSPIEEEPDGGPQAGEELSGYPGQIRRAMSQGEVQRDLGNSLLRLLLQVRYESNAITPEHWKPDGLSGLIVPGEGKHVGLPTGLAISGLLLNLALSPIDHRIAEIQHEASAAGRPWAFLRFADDMIVLAPTAHTLRQALEAIRIHIEGAAERPSNLRINQDKASPEPISKWLKETNAAALNEEYMKPYVLRRERLGSFVTRLVENMSRTSSTEAIARFGDAAAQRLQELADLALLDIEDGEVRADTRLSYAANRISSAYLPNEEGDVSQSSRHLDTIRTSIATAIDKAPWKFSLWRAAIRAACRRIPGADSSGEAKKARKWLRLLMRRARVGSNTKPTLDFGGPNQAIVALELSFIRTIVWRELSTALRDLLLAKRLVTNGQWSSQHWTFRAMDEAQIPDVITFLSDFDCWALALYDSNRYPNKSWWWEWEALLAAAHYHPSWDPFSPWNKQARTDAFGSLSKPFRGLLSKAPRATREKVKGFGLLVRVRVSRNEQNDERIADALQEIPEATVALWQAWILGSEHLVNPSIASKILKSRGSALWDLLLQRLARRRLMMDIDRQQPVGFVHELLWGMPTKVNWRICPRQAPAIPFSSQLAMRMLRDALADGRGPNPPQPRTWQVKSKILEEVRRNAFSSAPSPASVLQAATDSQLVALGSSKVWGVWRWHPAMDIPLMLGHDGDSLARHTWCHLLQFMTAATGSEHWLDLLLDHWPTRLPLDEQWNLRSRVHLPTPVWKAIDEILTQVLSGNALPQNAVSKLVDRLEYYWSASNDRNILVERVDVELRLDLESILDLPCSSGPLGGPPKLLASPTTLSDKVRVRLGQISTKIDWLALRDRFQKTGAVHFSRSERQRTMHQVLRVFQDGDLDCKDHTEGPVLLPEVAVPWEEFPAIRKLVQFYNRAALAGMLWREQSPFLPLRPPRTMRYLVNEASLLVPLSHGKQRTIRCFTIQKPLPAHFEEALVRSVSTSSVTWQLLPGRRWYRFVHPKWGDFTVAICSDIIDPTPWNSMQGVVAHLLMVACNKDIETFESLTWIRAFELHANVVAVNQGDYGGSFVWTPEAGHNKEIARLRGPQLSLVADVSLKVKSLMGHQRNGVKLALQRAQNDWNRGSQQRHEFKAPPPGYRGRV